MHIHPGLEKMFRNLSIASRRVEDRRLSKDKLRGYLKKIKIVSSQTAKKSVISAEIEKLEKHLTELITKKLKYDKVSETKAEREGLARLKEKEHELNKKIEEMNNILAKLGKRVDEEEFKEQLSSTEEEPSLIDELENKLYSLETKHAEMETNPIYPKDALDKVKEKISLLKEKLREAKNR